MKYFGFDSANSRIYLSSHFSMTEQGGLLRKIMGRVLVKDYDVQIKIIKNKQKKDRKIFRSHFCLSEIEDRKQVKTNKSVAYLSLCIVVAYTITLHI